MNEKTMKILIVEDDANECNDFIKTLKNRKEFELIAMTDSDIDALRYIKQKHPEGIILDIELNNSVSGSTDSFGLLDDLKNSKLEVQPIIVVTTHISSKRTYDFIHRKGVDIILYKGSPTYSCDYVLNKLLTLRDASPVSKLNVMKNKLKNDEDKISEQIYHELELVGINSKLKGREYLHDAILFLIQNPDSDMNVIRYLAKTHKKATNTISNGMQNAIIHAWRVSSLEDLTMNYKATVNYETGVPTPMEFIYYYVDKIKELI